MRRLRERRAADQGAALSPVPGGSPRDADECLLPAVEATIAALGLGEPYQGIAQLARVLASAIDEAGDEAAALRVLGPQLRQALEQLGGTPSARARMPARPPQRPGPSRLSAIRNAHMNSPAKRKRMGA